MTTNLIYAIYDDELPTRLPLATAADYPTALTEVLRLHEEFRQQLAANGEGCSDIWLTLRVDELQPGQPPLRRYVSAASGFH